MTLGFYHSTQNSDSFALPTFGFDANYFNNILNELKLVYSLKAVSYPSGVLQQYSGIWFNCIQLCM